MSSWQRCCACATAALLLLPLTGLAAEVGDHLNVPGAPRPDFLPPKPAETFELPPVGPSSVPSQAGPSAQVRIDRVVFRGNTVLPESELTAIAAPYVGRMVSASELEDLRQKLTRYYVDRGYVNSGVLLAEVSADNAAVFDVVEGRLTAVRLRGMERLNENYVARRFLRDADRPLNLDVLRERFQILLNDPLFDRMNARLLPDVRAGEAILDIDVVRARPYQLSAFFNNYRPPSIGSESLGLSGWVRNLTGQGDMLEASLQASPKETDTARGTLGWRMPLGYSGTFLSVATEHGRSSVIEESLRALNIRSTLTSVDAGLGQTLFESLAQKLTLGLNRVYRENRSFLLDAPFSFVAGEPEGVTREDLWRFWQEYSYRTETYVVAFRSTFTFGKNNIQDIAGLPLATPERRFQIWLGQAQFARQVMANGAQLIVRGTTQQTEDRLVPLDGISVGGVYTVRGYVENQLVRDVGEILNVEFEYPLVRSAGAGLNVVLIPFYDYGRARNNGGSAASISSLGLASRLRWQGLSVDIAIAKRLSHPDFINGPKENLQEKGIHFQLSYNFF